MLHRREFGFMFDRVKAILAKANLRPILGRLGGRSFLVVAFFAITGFWLEKHGKLEPSYAALASSLTGFHIWRARNEDNHDNH
jgi:hypothetical protein